jgi:glycosyltransferase involved in cell wall biosynthesis
MKICFLDKTHFTYTFKDKYSEKLRGAETALINLSSALYRLGHEITVFNNCLEEFNQNNFSWLNIDRLNKKRFYFDVAISNNNVNLLDNIICKKKFVWSHSVYTIEKFFRKRQFFSYLKNKPTYLLLGNYHNEKMSKLFKLFGTKIIDYGLDEKFLKTKINEDLESSQSIFFSRNDRNLDKLIEIWKEKIKPKLNQAKLLITPKKNKTLRNFNIIDRELGNQQKLINDLLESKLALIPGHKAELYCLAAEEAKELCLPIVSLGIGSLKERVKHNQDGLIAKNDDEFSKYVVDIYNNKSLWLELRKNLINSRGKKSWKTAAIRFINVISNSNE